MTWEIVTGLIVLTGGFISVMNVVIKVNRTLITLEEAVRNLREYIEMQDKRNEHFFDSLNNLDKRVAIVERIVFRSPDAQSKGERNEGNVQKSRENFR